MVHLKTFSLLLLFLNVSKCGQKAVKEELDSQKKITQVPSKEDNSSTNSYNVNEESDHLPITSPTKNTAGLKATDLSQGVQNKPQKIQISTIQKIGIEEMTRGFTKKAFYTPQYKEINHNGKVTKGSVTPIEWKELVEAVNKIGINNIDNYEAPSQDRFRDAALAATITITDKDTVYQSRQFDSGRPPSALKKLYDKLILGFPLK